MPLVIDASALTYALLSTAADGNRLRRRLASEECHAPHLVDAEIGSVLRRRVLRNDLEEADAARLLAAGSRLIDVRHEMAGRLAEAAWARRENVTFYDALYAALASALNVPLLTCDLRLAAAPGLGCSVEAVGAP